MLLEVTIIKDVYVVVKTERVIVEEAEIMIRVPIGIDLASEETDTLIADTIQKFMESGKANQKFRIHSVKVPTHKIVGAYLDKNKKVPLKRKVKR